MSLKSMTGYGRGSATGDGLIAGVEISSVNRKQLDVSISLPRGLSMLEARITEELSRSITRGRVSVDVHIDWSGEARRRAIRIDDDLAAAYTKILRETARKHDLEGTVSIQTLIALPDVLHFAQPGENSERVWTVLHKALGKAIKDLQGMRGREGRALQQDLRQRLDSLSKELGAVEKAAPKVVVRYRAALLRRIEEAGIEAQHDDRLLREIALFADRSDISEEITRLDSHLKQARRMTGSKEATGRALDFLAQEMFREINTIGSKANDAAILNHVIAFKAELERIREQVQNIE